MFVKFRCSECTQKLRIDAKFAGKLINCVRCGAKQKVPPETSSEFLEETQKPPIAFAEFHESPDEDSANKAHEELKEDWRSKKLPAGSIHFSEAEPEQEPDSEPSPEPVPESELLESPREPASPVADEPFGPDVRLGQIESIDGGEEEGGEQERFETEPVESAHGEVERVEEPAAEVHAEPSLIPPAKPLDVEEMVDMTAMVDIVFFLLIFFLVTSMHALDSTIPMPVPEADKSGAKQPTSVTEIDADDSYIVVRIDKNDKITVEGAEVRNERDLMLKLKDLRLQPSRPEKMLVVGHGDATHGTAVMVLDVGRDLGIDQVKLSVKDEEE